MKSIASATEKYKSLILEAERFIWQHPETGYRERKTSLYLENAFEKLGYTVVRQKDIPGFHTCIDTGKKGPEILILAELDSVICHTHKEADAITGAVHACGHHAQCAALLGIAAALTEKNILGNLCGKIRLAAVPAEELIELDDRRKLKEEGTIKYNSGKTEFLSRGCFDGVQMALMVHTSSAFAVNRGAVGCLVKRVTYKGRAAHAGGAPEDGINALYAANCGISAINAIRETFKEKELIRVHPIITKGGKAVNAIPDSVCLEAYVRGVDFDAIKRANQKVNRALIGGALSIGANIDICDIHGYTPLQNDSGMMRLASDAAVLALPDTRLYFDEQGITSGSTDMGDLSCLMPVIHAFAGGAAGTVHGSDYQIIDASAACVASARWQLAMLHLLLKDDAARAKKIIADFHPLFESKQAFLAYLDSLHASGNRIVYHENQVAEVHLN